MKTLLLAFLTIGVSFAHAEGTRGGGDTYSIQFVSIASKISDYFHQSLMKGIDVDQLDQAIKSTVVESTDQNLTLDGVPKDAINYPDAKRIIFNRQRWTAMELEERPALVLHEYLGILKIENATYEYSKDALVNFHLTPLIRGRDSTWWLCSGTDLVVNLYDHRSNSGDGRDFYFTMLHGGQTLLGEFKNTDGQLQSKEIDLKQAYSTYASFVGQVSVDWDKQTLTIDGTIRLKVDATHSDALPYKEILHCEEKGDLNQN